MSNRNMFSDDYGLEEGVTRTQNGALTHKSTGSAVLDFFSMGGAMRNQSEKEIISLFQDAYNEDALLAAKALFYLRDIRGGQGERQTFRTILSQYPNLATRNLQNIVEMGRWDDLFSFIGSATSSDGIVAFIGNQLKEDVKNMKEGKSISLLSKWLPSENTSSQTTRKLARVLMSNLGYSPKRYRQLLSSLRRYLKVVETKMSSNDWTGINYEQVPSRAFMIYAKAFAKHDPEGYTSFKSKVKTGEAKINSSTLYPYDIVRKILQGERNETLELQWENLPNYIPEDSGNALVVADVSGSMFTTDMLPISSSVALVLYFAERNKGVFKDTFMTFSTTPEIVRIKGNTITEKINNISEANWGMSTDLQSSLRLLLKTAVDKGVPKEDMPTTLYIVSDMEFNGCVHGTNLDGVYAQFESAGYNVPTIVFWRVDTKIKQSPAQMNKQGIYLVSGQSPSLFAQTLKSLTKNPYDLMVEILSQERYNTVTV